MAQRVEVEGGMRLRFRRNSGVDGPGRPVALLAAALLLAACAPAGPEAASTASAPSPPRVTRTLRMGSKLESNKGIAVFTTQNANQLEVAWMFHQGLSAYDAQGNLEGRVARKVPSVADGDWRVNADGTMELTWKLRPNVKWHDGAPLTADDFAFGIQIVKDPEVPLQRWSGINLVTGVTAPDAETLVVRWAQPYFGATDARPDTVPAVPRHILGDLYAQGDKAAFTNSPYWATEFIGLGPYKLGQWEQGSFMEGLAFDDYFLGRPRIDRVVIRYITDPNVLLASFQAGEQDIVPSGLTTQDRQILGKDPAVSIIQSVGNLNTAIWQYRDPTVPWVGDVRVRQALLYMVDRETMADTFEPGGIGPIDLLVAPNDQVYRLVEQRGLTKYPYDPAKATQLLADAGWTRGSDGVMQNRSGQRFTIEVRVLGDSPPTLTLADAWKRGGLEVPYTALPLSLSGDERMVQVAQSQGVRWGGGAIGDDLMAQFTTAEIRGDANRWTGLNQGGYSNPAIDLQYAQYSRELDTPRRNSLFADFVKQVADEVLRLPFYYGSAALAERLGLRGPAAIIQSSQPVTWNIHEWDME
jgi:peptide/nickel transport system substrate-binding protein